MSLEFPKIDSSNLWDQSYVLLKERIIRREFKPNQKLIIPDLAKSFGISRTPIRDALNRLEMDGLVRTVAKVGTFVTPITPSDIHDIMETRLILELWSLGQILEAVESDRDITLKSMEHIITQAKETLQTSIDDYLKADFNLNFHLELIKFGKNHRNIAIYNHLMNYRFITHGSSLVTEKMCLIACEQHQAIITAIRHGDKARAENTVRDHMLDSKNRLLTVIEENGGVI